MARRLGLVVMLLVLALASWWLSDRVAQEDARREALENYDPDATMDNFTRWTMDEAGHLKSRLTATHMEHFPHDDSTEFEQPRVQLYRAVGSPWNIESERAWVNGSGEVMILYGDVTIWRDNPDGSKLELLTRDLKVLLENEYAETDAAATLRDKASVIDAVGMRADLGKSHIEFLDNVQSRHEPNSSH